MFNYWPREVYQVDMTTGEMTLARRVDGISLWMVGAAFSPSHADTLYVFDVSIGWNNDDLLGFDTANHYARTDIALEIFESDFNAGPGDLAAMRSPNRPPSPCWSSPSPA